MNKEIEMIGDEEIAEVVDRNNRLIEALKLFNEKLSVVKPSPPSDTPSDCKKI
jgi:hypothetical protein